MNYFYLNKYEKFTDIINGEVDYAYFVNPDNMAPIIINDIWNVYYNYITNDKRFPIQTKLNEITYDDKIAICNEINKDAIIAVTKNITPMLINQFIFKQDDPKNKNKVAKAYLKARIATLMSYYSEMLGLFPEIPKGYDESGDLMSSTGYLDQYTMNELISNNLKNITKYVNNSLICSLTLNMNVPVLYKLLLDKINSNINVTFSLPLTITTLNNTNVNILILLKGTTDTLNNFVIKTTINTPLIIIEPNTTVPVPVITNKYMQIFFQLNDIIAHINSENSTSTKKKISLVDTSSINTNSSTITPFYIQYKMYIIIAILMVLLLSCCVSILMYRKKQK